MADVNYLVVPMTDGSTKYLPISTSVTCQTRPTKEQVQAQINNLISTLPDGAVPLNCDVTNPGNPGGGSGGSNGSGGNYTGTAVQGPQSNTNFLNLTAKNQNTSARSFEPQNNANPVASGGETLQTIANGQNWSNYPIQGVYAMGWPHVYHVWSVVASQPPYARRGDSHQRGQSILIVK